MFCDKIRIVTGIAGRRNFGNFPPTAAKDYEKQNAAAIHEKGA